MPMSVAVAAARAGPRDVVAPTTPPPTRDALWPVRRVFRGGDNDGVIGDVGQPLMHVLTRYIRQAHMAEAHIRDREFRAPPANGGFESSHLASNPLPPGKATPYLESPYRKRDNSKGSTSP
jgi:hypothetical protein